jgi:DNA-binding transcriptional ArsR family regulator
LASLPRATELFRALADPTRLRLFALLRGQELTVAELVAVTGLAQSRVSSHLARLKEAGLVRDRREGAASYYALAGGAEGKDGASALFALLGSGDPVLRQDARAAREVVRQRRKRGAGAAERIERSYAPGRSWEALFRGVSGLLRLGDVLDAGCGDAAVADLLAPYARRITCLDVDARALEAARIRLRGRKNVVFRLGDMHAPPFPDASFDEVLLLDLLPCSLKPERLLAEAARVLRPGGALVATTLAPHRHAEEARRYGHVRWGDPPRSLRAMARRAGLFVELCARTSRERRPPHFEIVTLHARKR